MREIFCYLIHVVYSRIVLFLVMVSLSSFARLDSSKVTAFDVNSLEIKGESGRTVSYNFSPDKAKQRTGDEKSALFLEMSANSLKYGMLILVLIGIIIFLIIRNKQALNQKEQLELKNKVVELELKVVKAQMNPHFISNCLAAIQELIYTNDVDKAGQYIAKFSYFLRQVLNYSDKNYITLEEELEVIRLNVELEQLRFKDKFEFEINIAENIVSQDTLIPPLLTQPFIENAIWHGLLLLNDLRRPKLIIYVERRNGYPVIEIEDNGVGRNLSGLSQKSSRGTKLIMDKIEGLNKISKASNFKLQIIDLSDDQNHSAGTKIIIQLDNIKE